jgi:hypothetical protein
MPQINSASQITPTPDRTKNAIASAAAKTGVDFGFLVNQARIESGMNPNARANTSSASGLFQFTKQTWLGTVKDHGANHGLAWAAGAITARTSGGFAVSDPETRQAILNMRYNPEAASAMAAELARDNNSYLSAELDRAPEQVDLYLAHFLGESGAAKFLKAYDQSPDAAAAPSLPAAAAANRAIFYNTDDAPRSFREIRDSFAAKLNRASPPSLGPSISAANAFAQRNPALSAPAIQTSHMQSRDALQMRAIEPMPQRLSLEFARSTYQRLAALQNGGVAR